jgi:hypothetical protein
VYHGLAIAICLTAALALIAGAVRALFPNARSVSGFGHAVQHPLEQYVGASHLATDIIFGTVNSRSAAQKGWSLIDRTLRAKRAVRLAVR